LARILLDGYQEYDKLTDLEWEAMPWLMRSQWAQFRLRGSRKVAEGEQVSYVLDRYFKVVEWLDSHAVDFFSRLHNS
jgi:hypothetical protein